MTARQLDGKQLASTLQAELKERVQALASRGILPTLAVVLVGDDPASAVYVRTKERRAAETGLTTRDIRLPASTSTHALLAQLDALNADAAVHGILVQLPLPPHVDTALVLQRVHPHKDVDGFHPENLGLLLRGTPRVLPCTPHGCMKLLKLAGVSLQGAHAVVIGRSQIVGLPMFHLLVQQNATVCLAHSHTRNVPELVAKADVVVAAVGRAKFVQGSWLKPGAVVLDVGINRLPDGTLCGDVDAASAQDVAGALTPVPGGVGPMTIACLLANVVQVAERYALTV